MDGCPPELHSYICHLACADDGPTVRALTLVSKYFAHIARPFLYQSLAISGLQKSALVASKLENTPPHLRRIRHLFISDNSPDDDADNKLGAHAADSRHSASILRILNFAAPTLQTLAFISVTPVESTQAIARLFRLSFPNLRELTVSGYYPFPSLSGSMPALKRLHLSGNRNPHGLLQMGGLDEMCPSLTHLRISGLVMAVSFAAELREAFDGGDAAPFGSKLPPHVQHVVVQPGRALPVSGKPPAVSREQLMIEQLEAIVGSKDVRFTLLASGDVAPRPHDFLRDWLDRLVGKEGCWAC